MSEQEFNQLWRAGLREAIAAAGLPQRAVATWLGLDPSMLSKRLRDEVQFTVFEFVRLSERFSLPMTPADMHSPGFRFRPSHRARGTFDEAGYFQGLEGAFARFLGPGVPESPPADTDIRISSSDLPIFWFFGEPELAAIKLFAFSTSNGDTATEPFSLDQHRAERRSSVDRANRIAALYQVVDSREVWGRKSLDSFLGVLLHLAQCRLLTQGDANLVFVALRRLVECLSAAASQGRKPGGGSFTLHVNAHHTTNSVIGVQAPQGRALYLTFDNPHFLASHEAHANAYFEDHFQGLLERSSRTNGSGAYSARVLREELHSHIGLAEQRLKLVYEQQLLAF